MKRKTPKGKIDYTSLNIPPEKHEIAAARFFVDRGLDVIFARPSSIKGSNSPDFQMCGKNWETKSPVGNSERTYDDAFRKALKQSRNIIFDLRRMSIISEDKCLKVLRKKALSPK